MNEAHNSTYTTETSVSPSWVYINGLGERDKTNVTE